MKKLGKYFRTTGVDITDFDSKFFDIRRHDYFVDVMDAAYTSKTSGKSAQDFADENKNRGPPVNKHPIVDVGRDQQQQKRIRGLLDKVEYYKRKHQEMSQGIEVSRTQLEESVSDRDRLTKSLRK